MLRGTVAVLATVVAFQAAPAVGGDPAQGERLFRQCAACHLVDQAQSRPTGPHLVGLFGREAGALDDFNYSPAMSDSDIVWDEETIDAYIADPRGYIPGNRMAFAGVRNPQHRLDIIA
jgi:cytochrome c